MVNKIYKLSLKKRFGLTVYYDLLRSNKLSMFYIDYNYAHCIACCMFYHYGNNAMLTFFSLDCGLSRRGNILNFKGAVVCGGLRRALHNARCQLHLSLSDTLRITLLDDFETTIFLFSSRIWKSFVSM